MANKQLFSSASVHGLTVPPADATNEAGGVAYRRSPKEALTQFALTGTFGDTYYTNAQAQLDTVMTLAQSVDREYIAKLAVYARKRGFMKDMPAFLLALLSNDPASTRLVFPHVVDNGKMLRNYVQIIRSGMTGRKSLGTALKRLVNQWILDATPERIVAASVGNSPSLADIIRMTHPKARTYEQGALLAWVIGKVTDDQRAKLPAVVLELERFRADPTAPMPDVPFELLTSTPLTPAHWTQIAVQCGWHATRMNLNTFLRAQVFSDPVMVQRIAAKLTDRELVKRSRVMPYQCLTAFLNVDPTLPMPLKLALQDVLDMSLENTPRMDGKQVIVLLDVSGSMSSPVTGYRGTATTKIRCVDVAAMVAAALVKANPNAVVIPFESHVITDFTLNPRDSVATMAQTLAQFNGGGTNCGAALQFCVSRQLKADLIVFISDNESWMDARGQSRSGTAMAAAWQTYKRQFPHTRMACIDLTPYNTTQLSSTIKDVINIGGFSDNVFTLLDQYVNGRWTPEYWVEEVSQTLV